MKSKFIQVRLYFTACIIYSYWIICDCMYYLFILGSMHRRRIRRRLQISKHNRGFIDFKPQVLESRTRRKSGTDIQIQHK